MMRFGVTVARLMGSMVVAVASGMIAVYPVPPRGTLSKTGTVPAASRYVCLACESAVRDTLGPAMGGSLEGIASDNKDVNRI